MPYKDPVLARAQRRNRDHITRATASDITATQELAMRQRARTCPLCSVRLTSKHGQPNSKELDHIVPLNQGGTHTHGNVRIICRTCNVRRPKDGSDYAGPVTLWAQGEVPVSRSSRPSVTGFCRKGLHPWTLDNIHVGTDGLKRCRACLKAKSQRQNGPMKKCRCGVMFPAPGNTLTCPTCTDATGRQAATLHAAGIPWDQVAARIGYGSAWGAAYAAKRTGYVPAAKPAKADPRACPDCGTPRPKYAQHCEPCTTEKAWRAVGMRQGGATLQGIAAQLGYSSITSVTNLMKTVAAIEPQMGRPRRGDPAVRAQRLPAQTRPAGHVGHFVQWLLPASAPSLLAPPPRHRQKSLNVTLRDRGGVASHRGGTRRVAQASR